MKRLRLERLMMWLGMLAMLGFVIIGWFAENQAGKQAAADRERLGQLAQTVQDLNAQLTDAQRHADYHEHLWKMCARKK